MAKIYSENKIQVSFLFTKTLVWGVQEPPVWVRYCFYELVETELLKGEFKRTYILLKDFQVTGIKELPLLSRISWNLRRGIYAAARVNWPPMGSRESSSDEIL